MIINHNLSAVYADYPKTDTSNFPRLGGKKTSDEPDHDPVGKPNEAPSPIPPKVAPYRAPSSSGSNPISSTGPSSISTDPYKKWETSSGWGLGPCDPEVFLEPYDKVGNYFYYLQQAQLFLPYAFGLDDFSKPWFNFVDTSILNLIDGGYAFITQKDYSITRGRPLTNVEALDRRLNFFFTAATASISAIQANVASGVGNLGAGKTITVYRVEGVPNTRILIGEGGQVVIQGKQTLFLNIGSEVRAQEFLAQRLGQGMEGVTIKQFQVSESFFTELKAAAVPESMARQFPGRPILVDPTKAPNQFGIRPNWFLKLLDAIVPGSAR